MKEFDDIFIDAVISTLERKGITRANLARKLNIKPQTLGKYLLKQSTMPIQVALIIANELQINMNKICEIDYGNFTDKDYEILEAIKTVSNLLRK